MPYYKILGIYSFAENIKKMHLNDQVILKKEVFNLKSKNAIGVYSTDNQKLGYLPVENQDEIKNFNNSYRISNLKLNQEYPILEISRYYEPINYLDNVEYPFEKKIKYEYVLADVSPKLQQSIVSLEKYLKTKRIKVKRTAVIYVDENYVNILIEVSKGFEQFQTVTLKFFKENAERYEELYENGLLENTFFKDLMFYRLECYIENNYERVIDMKSINNQYMLSLVQTLEEEKIHDELEIEMKKVDILLIVKLYLRYLLTDNSYYLLKYPFENEYTDVKKVMKKIIVNYKVLNEVVEKYNLKLGKFTYDHKLKIYEYIDFTNDDTVFIISDKYIVNYVYLAHLTNKKNLIVYNPLDGTILKINNISLDLTN
jgi:hypothetical protein